MLQLCYFFVKIEGHKGKSAVSDCRKMMQKKHKKLIFILLCVALSSAGCQRKTAVVSSDLSEELQMTEDGFVSETEQQTETQEQIRRYIYVCGAVNNPGVYPISEDMRVFEAVDLAGGFADEADTSWVNQAEPVQDGQKLYIYTKEETSQMADPVQQEDTVSAGMTDGKVNINQAAKETLMTLPGIGEAKADAVIQYRETYGAFASIEEIQNVPGIKNAVFLKIQDYISVG